MLPLTPELWLELAAKGTLVIAAAAGMASLLRRASAAARHLVWAASLGALLALPVLSALVPRIDLPIVPSVLPSASVVPDLGAAVAADAAVAAPMVLAPVAPSAQRAVEASITPPSTSGRVPGTAAEPGRDVAGSGPGIDWVAARRTVLPVVWAAGAAFVLLRFAVGAARLRSLVGRAAAPDCDAWGDRLALAEAELGIRSRVVLVSSPEVGVPMTCGLLRPVIVLPTAAADWPPARARVVLLHELAHIGRRDCLVQCVAQAALAVHWWNPLAWMAAGRLRAERERACDDLVLVAGTRGSEYARHLLDIVQAARGWAPASAAAISMARPSELEGRVVAMLDPRCRRGMLRRRSRVAAIALATAVVAGIAGLQLQEPADAALILDEPAAPARAAQTPASPPRDAPQPVPAPGDRAPESVRGGVAGGVDGGAPGGVREGVRGGAQGGVPSGVEGDTRAGAPRVTPGGAPGGVPPRGQGQPGAAPAQPDGAARRSDVSDAVRDNVAQALAAALNDESAEVREQAIQALVRLRSPLVFDPLTTALGDSNPDVRHQAAAALGQLGDSRAAAPLAKALADANAGVREQAIFGLAQLNARDHASAVAGALKDSSPDVRRQAAFALGQLGVASTVSALMAALKDANAEVRQQTAFALGQIGDTRAIDALTAALKDADVDVRSQVVFALGQLVDADREPPDPEPRPEEPR